MAKGRKGKHRRIGCTLENCGVKYHESSPEPLTVSFWDRDLMLNPYMVWSLAIPSPVTANRRNYVTVPEYQAPCQHKASPNCLRQRCLEERRIPFEVKNER